MSKKRKSVGGECSDELPDIEECALSQHERIQVRSKLLSWYDSKRRRLPWRGDPPPYVLSLASHGVEAKHRKKVDPGQRKISRFFGKVKEEEGTLQPPGKKPLLEDADRANEMSTTAGREGADTDSPPTLQVSAYGTWVSEVMLQQTRVETVVDYYERWMARFPDLATLAAATPDEVNSCWAGLGYYRRARGLHEGAKKCVAELGGCLPSSAEALQREIKGVGPYTAGAVASIAFGERAAVVDGNVVRVFSRLHALDHPPAAFLASAVPAPSTTPGSPSCSSSPSSSLSSASSSTSSSLSSSSPPSTSSTANAEAVGTGSEPLEAGVSPRVMVEPRRDPAALLKPCWSLAEGLLDPERPGDFNQALMELGATVCTPKAPDCAACPVRLHCRAEQAVRLGVLQDVALYPAKPTKKPPSEHALLVLVLCRAPNRTPSSALAEEAEEEVEDEVVVVEGEDEVLDERAGGSGREEKKKKKSKERKEEEKREFLLVQRPASGLLAGQWEFPSVPIDMSGSSGGVGVGVGSGGAAAARPPNAKEVGSAAERLERLLRTGLSFVEDTRQATAGGSSVGGEGRGGGANLTSAEASPPAAAAVAVAVPPEVLDLIPSFQHPAASSSSPPARATKPEAALLHSLGEPVVHLFSHQRHTMYVVPAVQESKPAKPAATTSSETAPCGEEGLGGDGSREPVRQARWMNEDDLAAVGVTTGMKKVLERAQKKGHQEEDKAQVADAHSR